MCHLKGMWHLRIQIRSGCSAACSAVKRNVPPQCKCQIRACLLMQIINVNNKQFFNVDKKRWNAKWLYFNFLKCILLFLFKTYIKVIVSIWHWLKTKFYLLCFNSLMWRKRSQKIVLKNAFTMDPPSAEHPRINKLTKNVFRNCCSLFNVMSICSPNSSQF